MASTKKWTIMVYMAGDNGKVFHDGKSLMADLQAAGWSDLAEMAKVGSTDQINIIAQYDTLDNQSFTPRFYLDQSSPTGKLLDRIPPVDTGDPKNLTDFVVWGVNNYPAEQYALILWNHGTGWKEDDIYAKYCERVERARCYGEMRAGGKAEKLLQQSLFLSTAGEIMSIEDDDLRGICYDDSSMSFLDNQALESALKNAQEVTGCHLAILGMDACLMGMIEVAYQIQDVADFMVASQEVEPADGWPYERILKTLTINPDMSSRDLSRIIVKEFGEYYKGMYRDGGGRKTQSAVDTKRVQAISDKINVLVKHIQNNFNSDRMLRFAIEYARNHAQTFQDTDYLDLKHLLEILKDEHGPDNDLCRLIDNILVEFTSPGEELIVANFHGAFSPHANGISIYFPPRLYSQYYEKQRFVSSGWNGLIRKVLQL